jgi:hypothetical protein
MFCVLLLACAFDFLVLAFLLALELATVFVV